MDLDPSGSLKIPAIELGDCFHEINNGCTVGVHVGPAGCDSIVREGLVKRSQVQECGIAFFPQRKRQMVERIAIQMPDPPPGLPCGSMHR